MKLYLQTFSFKKFSYLFKRCKESSQISEKCLSEFWDKRRENSRTVQFFRTNMCHSTDQYGVTNQYSEISRESGTTYD